MPKVRVGLRSVAIVCVRRAVLGQLVEANRRPATVQVQVPLGRRQLLVNSRVIREPRPRCERDTRLRMLCVDGQCRG